jgi:hypothetical protein
MGQHEAAQWALETGSVGKGTLDIDPLAKLGKNPDVLVQHLLRLLNSMTGTGTDQKDPDCRQKTKQFQIIKPAKL